MYPEYWSSTHLVRASNFSRSSLVHQSLQIPFGVELAAFIVEAVGKFVADGAAGVAVVGSVVHFRIVERRLQHAGREVDVVHLRIEVSVNGGSGDVPFAVVDGLADLVDVAAALELVGALDVAGEIIAHNLHRTVVAPLVGIADLVADARQLDQRLLLGFRAHPVERADALPHRVFDAPHHIERALLELGGKDFGHIHLSQRLAQAIVDILHAAFPAGLHALSRRAGTCGRTRNFRSTNFEERYGEEVSATWKRK